MRTIAVVTGASRGAGKGIAIALDHAGMTVYVTGRSVGGGDSPFDGSVDETAKLVSEAGGEGIGVAVDHANDATVATLFARIKQEHGRLDILVNNAAKLLDPIPDGFWQKPLETVDLITVGLRIALRGRLLRRPPADCEWPRADRQHRPLWRSILLSGARVRGAEGRGGQNGGRHGQGIAVLQSRRGLDLDGRT
jgi:NAD(P)-dependent dehydrogenase (short-subunit alcohol dehydrogenase family)